MWGAMTSLSPKPTEFAEGVVPCLTRGVSQLVAALDLAAAVHLHFASSPVGPPARAPPTPTDLAWGLPGSTLAYTTRLPNGGPPGAKDGRDACLGTAMRLGTAAPFKHTECLSTSPVVAGNGGAAQARRRRPTAGRRLGRGVACLILSGSSECPAEPPALVASGQRQTGVAHWFHILRGTPTPQAVFFQEIRILPIRNIMENGGPTRDDTKLASNHGRFVD